jgi:hypothetical protein
VRKKLPGILSKEEVARLINAIGWSGSHTTAPPSAPASATPPPGALLSKYMVTPHAKTWFPRRIKYRKTQVAEEYLRARYELQNLGTKYG